MPIEIKELHIKVSVTAPKDSKASDEVPKASTSGSETGANREKIVSECVEKVLEIIRNKNER
jgi:hypothetical protein